MDIAFEILKWVLLILLAGFIGQFGKSLSLRIIHYFQNRRRKEVAHAAPVAQGADRTVGAVSIEAEQREKKEVAHAAPAAREEDSPAGAVSGKAEQKAVKKMLKNQIKLEKKREKLKSKDSK